MIVAVVGLGSMGRNHVRVLRELPEVDDVVGVDPSDECRAHLRRLYRLDSVPSLSDLRRGSLDAAVIATPSSGHAEAAIALLRDGVPCLIEKPMAQTPDEAALIIRAAGGRVAGVGHVERFNPAVIELRRRISCVGRLLAVSSRRIGPYPARIRDVGVRLDLLTHDLDVVRHITGAEPCELHAVSDAFLGSNEDLIFVTGRLTSGAILSMEAGWLSPTKVREVRVVGEAGTLLADTLLQELYFQENAVGEARWEAMANFRGITEGNVTRFAIPREEPLRAELRHFLAAVRGEPSDIVSLSDGLEAVRLADSLDLRRTCMTTRP
jgi:predicted dehydrogenase